MKTFATLLKVAQGRADALGLEAARLTERVEGLRMKMAETSAREKAEAAMAAADPLLAPFMPAYQRRVKDEIAAAETAVAEAEATLELVRERLADAWREKTKFEKLIERARLAELAEEAAAEQSALDEAAVNRVGRT